MKQKLFGFIKLTKTSVVMITAIAVLAGGFFVSVANATITSLTLTAPNGGEEWRGTQNITWTQTGGVSTDLVSILFSSDSGGSYNEVIATGVDVTLGTYVWDTNNTAAGALADGSTYRIRVNDGATGLDLSSADFMVDNTAPVTTEVASPASPNGANGWYVTVPDITLTCGDGVGSGCSDIFYDWNDVTPTTEYTLVLNPAEGINTLSYYSEDNAVDKDNLHNKEVVSSTEYKIDTTLPTVAVTSTTVDGYYNVPDQINVTLTFSENVTSTNTLTVTMNTGGTCSVPIISNTNTATCTYTVGVGENTSDLTVSSIVPASGVVEDIAGNDSTLLPTSNIADTSAIVIDTTVPVDFTVGSVITTGGTVVANYWNSTNTDVSVTTPVANDASLTGGTIQLQAEADGTFENVGSAYTILVGDLGGNKTLSLTASELEAIAGFSDGDTVSLRAVTTDIAGNPTTGSQSLTTLSVDQTAPSVNAGTDKEVKVLVAQDATTFDAGSGILSHQWTKTSGAGVLTFSADTSEDTNISAGADDTYVALLTVIDNAGNSATDNITFVWDTTAPVLGAITLIANPTNDTTPSYEFSADHVGWLTTTGSVLYVGACGNGDLVNASAGNNTTTFSTLAQGTYTNCDITVTDAAGNVSLVLEVNDFEIDTTVAVISSITTEDDDNDGSIDKATVVFTDEVDDSTFSAGDFTISGTEATAIVTGTADDDTLVLTFGTEITGTEAKTLVYAGTATDLAGNTIAGFSTLATDLAGPVLISARTVTTTSVEATFSEDLNGATVNGSGDEFAVVGYAVSAASETGAGVVTLTVATMPTDATPTVTYNYVGPVGLDDLNGNETVDGSFAVAVDEVVPVLTSVSISSDNAKSGTTWAKEGNTVTVAFTGSEALNVSPSVMIVGESATVTNVGGNNWTATLVMDADDTEGAITFTIDFEDVATPAHNVGGQVTAVNDGTSIVYDRTNPSVDAGTNKEVNAVVSQDATTSDTGSGLDTHQWSKQSGTGLVTFGTPTTVDTTISADTDGTYTLRLTVEDEAGNTAFDEMTFIRDTTNPEPLSATPSNASTGISLSADTATVLFDEPIVLLDSSRVLLVRDSDGTSYKGAVAVSGGNGNSAILNIDYTGLDYGTKYRINVKSNSLEDVAGNNNDYGWTTYFTTAIDTIPPVVNSFSASSITTTGATLNVTTNESAMCAFATTDSAYVTMTAFDTTGGTTHTQVLTGLSSSTGYDYYVRCADTTAQTNTMTTSANVSFTTLTPDTTGPVISNIQSTSITSSGATITWTTDENATSVVEYGLTSAYGSSSAADATADNTSHSVALTGLSDGVDYHFRVISVDGSTNSSTSGDNTFTTVAVADTTAPSAPVITTSATTIDSDTYTVAGTVADDGGTRVVTLYNGSTLVGTASVPTGDTAWSVLAPLTQDSANVFKATADDVAGNTSADSTTVTIIEATTAGDTTAPAVPVITTTANTVDSDSYTITGTAGADSPADGPRTIVIYRDGTVVGSIVVPTGDTAWSFVAPLVQSTTNSFAAISVDQSNNASAASTAVTITEATVADSTPPVITLLGQNPMTLTVGDTFTDPGATASDDVDGDLTSSIVKFSTVNTAVAGTYTVTYNVSDAATNAATQETRTVVVEAAFDDTATLVVTGIDAVKTYATADDSYINGWSWTYHITVPTSETQFKMKFSDFVSGANSIAAASNIRFYSAQASANANSANPVTISAADTYSAAITLDADLEPTTAGRQIEVTVEMKVPTGSAGGSYSGSYGVNSI